MFALINSIRSKVNAVENAPCHYTFMELRADINRLETDLALYMKHVEANEALLLADMPLEIEEL